jgi:hypothetical protein
MLGGNDQTHSICMLSCTDANRLFYLLSTLPAKLITAWCGVFIVASCMHLLLRCTSKSLPASLRVWRRMASAAGASQKVHLRAIRAATQVRHTPGETMHTCTTIWLLLSLKCPAVVTYWSHVIMIHKSTTCCSANQSVLVLRQALFASFKVQHSSCHVGDIRVSCS